MVGFPNCRGGFILTTIEKIIVYHVSWHQSLVEIAVLSPAFYSFNMWLFWYVNNPLIVWQSFDLCSLFSDLPPNKQNTSAFCSHWRWERKISFHKYLMWTILGSIDQDTQVYWSMVKCCVKSQLPSLVTGSRRNGCWITVNMLQCMVQKGTQQQTVSYWWCL